MPPKKAAAAATQKKAAAAPSHPSYRDMIKEAILQVSRFIARLPVVIHIIRPSTPHHHNIFSLR
ncbi:MAG: hypothetical protein L6R40_002788 [Gallowayella cf. fulva]|nr:MAG: hypothetical protein L6R40_002788 [Xanthomendoza cf. fulva]